MKNFPDHSQFDELAKRLQGYTEDPDELVWQNIDKTLRPQRAPLWIPWVDRIAGLSFILLLALWINVDMSSNVTNLESPDKRAIPKESSSLIPFEDSVHNQQEPTGSKQTETRHEKLSSTKQNYKSSAGSSYSSGILLRSGQRNHTHLLGEEVESILISSDTSAVASISSSHDFKKLEDHSAFDSLVLSLKQTDSILVKNNSPQTVKRIPKRGRTFYFSITPQLSFQRIIPVSHDGIVISKFKNQSIFTANRFAISMETGVQGHINKRWEYYGGISIYRQQQTLTYNYQVDKQVTLTSADDLDYVITPKNNTGSVHYNMLNLDANAGLLYDLQGGKMSHKIGGGLSYQYGFQKSPENYDNSKSNYVFYHVFYRNEVSVGARFRIYVQPSFSHTLYTKEKLDAPFHLKPYRAGIGFGVLYDF